MLQGLPGDTENRSVQRSLIEPAELPAALDHLADHFMREGWSVKRLIGELVRTNTYRMSTQRTERSRRFLPFRSVARMLGVSPSRYYSWRRSEDGCDLEDRSSCPRTSPHQLTPDEVQTIREMVTSPEHRHVPTGTLAVLAGRLGKVFAVIRLLDSRRAYVHAVIDNFSRWILA